LIEQADFFGMAAWAEIKNWPKSKQTLFDRENFYISQDYKNCLASPKVVKYKSILAVEPS
jgi:hypothetical protein